MSLPPHHYSAKAGQRGAALMVMLVIMTLGVLTLLVSSLKSSSLKNARQARTASALALAKDALIGWSISRGDIAGKPRPGELPCPDITHSGTAAGTCAAGAIGRLPWKTLGIEELKDGDGEALWYSIDGAFRIRFGSAAATNQPINSDTRASLRVYGKDGTTLLTPPGSEAVAIIFAPGSVINAQQRGTAAEQTAAANYLDNAAPPNVAVARNNAIASGVFIHGEVTDTSGNALVNDSLLIISTRDLMPIVEKRVAAELKSMLAGYFNTNGFYPYPAKYNDSNCLDVGNMGYNTDCQSDSSQCIGRLPDTAVTTTPATPDWNGVSGWFYYNLWGQVIYYAVGTNYLASAPANCSASLTVNGTPGTPGLFIMPGTPLGNTVRNSPNQSSALAAYIEDATNQDGWTTIPPNSDSHTLPTANSNDRIQLLP
ncbi:MAG: hypothetical protein PHP70_02040 [Gallionella sp.]|nr:hypothetical protein [Gallionella sp.]